MTILEAVKQSKTPALMQKKAIKAAQEALQPEETVYWAMTANVCDKPGADPHALSLKDMVNVVLVVTDRRIFYVSNVLGYRTVSHIPLWEVRSVQELPNFSSRFLQIQGITRQLLVEGHLKTIPPLCRAVGQALADRSAPAAQTAAPASAPLDTAQLQQLKQLYDEGVLTAEEFAAKKAQILGL